MESITREYSSCDDTETEEPLSSQEDYMYMKMMQPNLSDDINSVLKQEQPDCDSSDMFPSKAENAERNTYWKNGAHVNQNSQKSQQQSGKTLTPSISSNDKQSGTSSRDYLHEPWHGHKGTYSRGKDISSSSLEAYLYEADTTGDKAGQSGKTPPFPSPSSNGRVYVTGKMLSPSSNGRVQLDGKTPSPSISSKERQFARVAPCAEIVSVVTPSHHYYTSSTSIYAEKVHQSDLPGCSRGEATVSRSPASPSIEPAYKRVREMWAYGEGNVDYKKVSAYGGGGGGPGGALYTCNDDEGQISSTTAPSYIQDTNTLPYDQLVVTGKYLFGMEYEADTHKPAKSCNYTFSRALQKVFVQVDKVVPFKFNSEIPLPAQYMEIRAYLVYKDIHSREIVVDRCPHHLSRPEFSNPHHVMDTVDGHIAEHIRCPSTHRYITVLRPGVTHSNHKINSFCGNLRFRCASSCRGGIDRKPILALFELYVNNRFSGRTCIEVSICSSPGRDRINQEEKLYRMLYPEAFARAEEDSLQEPQLANEMRDTCFPAKGIVKEGGKSFDDDTFLIKVKGSKNAELIGRLAKQLNELEDRKRK